ncbi:MAG TPA: hypothetical protein DCQ31_17205 [Bacteroidales bacterium]|nr:hypothetical protein [Bacteroidales bacterium]
MNLKLYMLVLGAVLLFANCGKTTTETDNHTEFIKFYGNASEDNFACAIENNAGEIIFTGAVTTPKKGLQVYVAQVDIFGTVVKELFYGDSLNQNPTVIQQFTDGTYAILGNVIKPENGKQNIFFLKLNQNLEVIFDTVYLSAQNELCNSAVINSNSELIIGGSTDKANLIYANPQGTNDFLIRQLSANGTVLNEKIYGGSGADQIQKIKITDQYILAVGSTQSFSANLQTGYNAILLKLNLNAELIDTNTFGGEDAEFGTDIELLADGSVLLAYTGFEGGNGNTSQILLLKTASNSIHEVQWKNTVIWGTNTEAFDLLIKDNAIYVCGVSDRGGDSFKDAALFVCNPEGIVQQSYFWGYTGEEFARQMLFTNSGLYLFGNTKTGNNAMIQLIKPKLP